MPRLRLSGGPPQSKARLEALSDGVFSIALTLLIIDVVSVAKAEHPGRSLAEHLLHEWPAIAAYVVGFMTILVCWINHHRVFYYIKHVDSWLFWINGAQLALVSSVPVPTAVLAANVMTEERRTAVLLYGVTYFLMAISFWYLMSYVHRRGLTNPAVDAERYTGMSRIYACAIGWTLLCLAVALVSEVGAAVMWALMFAVFAFPAEFAHLLCPHKERSEGVVAVGESR